MPSCCPAGRVASLPAPPIKLSYQEEPLFCARHQHNLNALCFSPDGKLLATGSGDGNVCLWDAANGRLKSLHTSDASRGIDGLSFSPDGKLIAAVGGLLGKYSLVWDTTTGQLMHEYPAPPLPEGAAPPFLYKEQPIEFRVHSAVGYSPDGMLLATAAGGVLLGHVQSGNIVATLNEPAKGVLALAWTSDGKTLATAAEDKKVRLWNAAEGTLDATLTGPTLPIMPRWPSRLMVRIVAVTQSFSPAGRGRVPLLGGQCWILDRAGGRGRKLDLGKRAGNSLAFVSPSSVAIGAGFDVLLVDLHSDQPPQPRVLGSHSDEVLAVAASPDGRLIASGGRDCTVDVVDTASGQLVYRLPGLTDLITAVAVSPDGRHFATSYGDYRFSNRVVMEEPSFAARYKTYFAGERNASRCQASQLHIWSAGDGMLESSLPLPPCQVTSLGLPGPGCAVGNRRLDSQERRPAHDRRRRHRQADPRADPPRRRSGSTHPTERSSA